MSGQSTSMRRAPRRRWRTLGIALVALAAFAAAACDPSPLGPNPVNSPTPHAVPNFRHVFVLVLENESADSVFGSGAASAPYLNSLAHNWTYLDQSYGVDHASLPNYIAMTSGQPPTSDTKGDCGLYTCVYPDRIPNIADEVESSGRTWKAYEDGMPSACAHGTENTPDPYSLYISGVNTYAQRHNPFVYYGDIVHNSARCQAHDVQYSQLATDLAANNLPNYGFITPDLCHDGHDSSCGVPAADAWASQELPKLLNNADFKNGGVLFITFDEAASSDTSGCCGDSQGGHIGTIVISPTWGKPAGYHSTVPVNHYSLLRTIEDAWGLQLLGQSQDSGIAPMTDVFTTTPH